MRSLLSHDKRLCVIFLFCAFCTFFTSTGVAPGEDVFYRMSVLELTIDGEKLRQAPKRAKSWGWNVQSRQEYQRELFPRVVVEGNAEAYLAEFRDWERIGDTYAWLHVAIRAPRGREITGWLHLPKPDFSGMERLRFKVAPAVAPDQSWLKSDFHGAKENHYRKLLESGLPGAASFRWQMIEAAVAAGEKTKSVGSRDASRGRAELGPEQFDLFTGGRAISENLALDRPLLLDAAGRHAVVPVDSLTGVTIRQINWSRLTEGITTTTDFLSWRLPADQYAMFFPSFAALLAFIDEADAYGTPILQTIETRTEDAETGKRYRRQLCLESSTLARLFGPQVVSRLAVTGSDPYLRSGSDVAVLFEAKNLKLLQSYLVAKHKEAAGERNVKAESGEIDGVSYTGVRSPDRRICSYLATVDDIVIVTNSLHQLYRVISTRNKTPSLAALPEYKFFRHRYKCGEDGETGFLMVSDATIRRWCGPRWRIGNSRRTRAAAVLADFQARLQDDLVRGKVKPGEFKPPYAADGLGELRLTSRGVHSSVYGTLEFQTPIAELSLDKVTPEEARAYELWRRDYENQWRGFSFDPIAVRFSVDKKRLTADLTVMPLSAGSEYRWLQDWMRGKLMAETGDRHANALLNVAIASGGRVPFLGEGFTAISLHAEDGAFWAEMEKAEDLDEFYEKQGTHGMPIEVQFDTQKIDEIAQVVINLIAFDGDTETRRHNGRTYLKVTKRHTPRNASDKDSAYYAETPQGVVAAFNEDVIRRAMDRQYARAESAKQKKVLPEDKSLRPWLGEHVGLQFNRGALKVLSALFGSDYQRMMQVRCWGNLPILNELKRRYGDRDPLAVYEQGWGARLYCPGGGRYVWNDRWQTMESTVYGHPGHPKRGPILPQGLTELEYVDFGLTFENDGLRARTVLLRRAPPRPVRSEPE